MNRPRCDHCQARDPRKSYRLDPVNWKPEYKLLCKPCRAKHGYREVSYERAFAEAKAKTIMRGAA